MALFRLVDGDEGMYLLAARLVTEGQLPYHDFFFPQTFLVPYLYGAWGWLTGSWWYGGRLLSAALAVALGLVVYHHLRRRTGDPRWALLGVVLLAANGLAFSWLPLAKAYAVTAFLLFAAYVALVDGPPRRGALAAGLALGLAIDARLYAAAVVPVLAGVLLARTGRGERVGEVTRFAIGLGLALSPNLLFLWIEPGTFVFNLIGYHGLRVEAGLVGDLQQKGAMALLLFGIGRTDGVNGFQLGVLLLLAIAAVVVGGRAARPARLPAWLGLVVTGVSLLPTPTQLQYFCLAVPFLVVSGVLLLAGVAAQVAPVPAAGRMLRRLLAVGVAAYVVVAPFDLYRHTAGGQDVPGVGTPANAENWRIPTIRRVSRAIDAAMPPGQRLAVSWWSGYLVESRASMLRGLENHFVLWHGHRLDPAELARYRHLSAEGLLWHLWHHTAPVAVLGNVHVLPPPEWWDSWRTALARSGYTRVETIGAAEVYRWAGGMGDSVSRPDGHVPGGIRRPP